MDINLKNKAFNNPKIINGYINKINKYVPDIGE